MLKFQSLNAGQGQNNDIEEYKDVKKSEWNHNGQMVKKKRFTDGFIVNFTKIEGIFQNDMYLVKYDHRTWKSLYSSRIVEEASNHQPLGRKNSVPWSI